MKRYICGGSPLMITPAAIEPGDARSAGQRNSKHSALLSKRMGWMVCDFTSFSTVF